MVISRVYVLYWGCESYLKLFPFLFCQLKTLTQQQLEEYMAVLDQHMAQELETLRKRYHHKRLPILQAMDAKKKQQFRN